MRYEPKLNPGDEVRVVRHNHEVPNPTYTEMHNAVGMTFILPDENQYDANDNTWSLAHSGGQTDWINEECLELVAPPVGEDELAAAIASITGRPTSNPNIQSGTAHREISTSPIGVHPDDCPPLTVITIGHPANEIFCIKVPDAKYAKQNRWRNVATGKLVDPEDFRAGWNFYPPREGASA